MLLYFGVSGYLSFAKWQEMYLVPTSGARLKGTKYEHNFHLHIKNRPMKSVILFGDNASGKTNWMYALGRCVSIIQNGLRVDSTDQFHYNSPSVRFKISVCNEEGREYEYEIEYDREGVVLIENFKQDEKEIFSFANETINLSGQSNGLEQFEEFFSHKSTDTLLNKLRDWLVEPISEFRNLAAQILVESEGPINWGMKFLPMMSLEADELKLLEEYSGEVVKILQYIDPTLDNISFEEMISSDGGIKYEPSVTRQDAGVSKKFSIASEAQGIKKMIYHLPRLLQVHKGKTVVIDELDSSIGTKSLIRLFNAIINSSENTKGQLIVSSHNLSLLNLDMFHESQLQIFSKGADLGSVVHGLDRYEYRAVKKNLDEIYLKGGFES